MLYKGVQTRPSAATMVCSICRQPGHNRLTCYRHINFPTTSESPQEEVTLAPLDVRDVIISELRSEVAALTDQCAMLLQQLNQKRERKANARHKANIDTIQDILFTNQDNIPNGIYLSLMNALVGK